ncbi:hypothetical protein ABZY14_40275 [Streptomyces sp. NPDC006617]|uniref:hypothetical protein n=1 Tax=Streptomyces sp. NPDC006617 TaxID=3155354 RepID=UPI0033A73230
MSMQELERKHGVTWRTVRKALDSSWPEPRKQRHTITRIFHRLVQEHGADVSYGMVRYYVAARKPEILVESGRAPLEAFVPQTHQPGHEAEVDFGDVTIRLAGELVTCYLFSFRLSYSGRAVHHVFASCGQEAFFEGHVHALRTLGGVPRSKVCYDNLKTAVARVLGLSRARVEAALMAGDGVIPPRVLAPHTAGVVDVAAIEDLGSAASRGGSRAGCLRGTTQVDGEIEVSNSCAAECLTGEAASGPQCPV